MHTIKAIFISMRPEQWSKNLIVFAGVFFGMSILNAGIAAKAVQVFFIFCLLSGAAYIVNDIVDAERDRHIAEKKARPIAAGTLGVIPAMISAAAIFITCLVWSFMISFGVLTIVLAFMVLHFAYDVFLKHMVIIDVFSIAASFLLRLFAGLSIITFTAAGFSSWVLLCTVLLSLFLALCKRRSELLLLMDKSGLHRKSLEGYSEKYIDQLISITASATILSYALYTVSPETLAKHGTTRLTFTIPFVIYGMFRYLYLVYIKGKGLKPERLLIRDIPFLLNMVLYVACVFTILYMK
ncbi:MAG: decaprenyl-phosphate phosphoribosyltransferase [Candidatus Omnitrophota bacterium]